MWQQAKLNPSTWSLSMTLNTRGNTFFDHSYYYLQYSTRSTQIHPTNGPTERDQVSVTCPSQKNKTVQYSTELIVTHVKYHFDDLYGVLPYSLDLLRYLPIRRQYEHLNIYVCRYGQYKY